MTQEHIDFMLSKIPMGRFGKVEEIAALVCWLASEECSFSTGARVRRVGRPGDLLRSLRTAACGGVFHAPPFLSAPVGLRPVLDRGRQDPPRAVAFDGQGHR